MEPLQPVEDVVHAHEKQRQLLAQAGILIPSVCYCRCCGGICRCLDEYAWWFAGLKESPPSLGPFWR